MLLGRAAVGTVRLLLQRAARNLGVARGDLRGLNLDSIRPRFVLLGFLVLALTIAAFGCELSTPQSTLDPKGDVAEDQRNLFLLIFWVSVVIFVAVIGALAYIVFRFRARPGSENDVPPQTHGNTSLEIGWTIAPALVVLAVTIPTIRGIPSTYDPPSDIESNGEMTVQVVGHQWWWEYRYLDAEGELDFVTGNEMHIPVDTVVRLELRSADVIHSFSIPKLAGTRDAVPGRENRSWFIAREEGRYEGQCKEFCGESHAFMRTVVYAESQAEYEAWAEAQRQPAAPVTVETQAGLDLFFAKACIGCHTIDGVENAVGITGPNLTHVGSRTTLAANILDNDQDSLHEWLRDPPRLKPGSLMLDLDLTETEIATLATYLMSLQ